MRKKYSATFIWSHPFSTCGSYDRFFILIFCFYMNSNIEGDFQIYIKCIFKKPTRFLSQTRISFSSQKLISEGLFDNGEFNLLRLRLRFIIADNLRRHPLSWTTTVILTKVLSFGKEFAKAIILSNNNINNSIKQTQ